MPQRIDLEQLRAARPDREGKVLAGVNGHDIPLPAEMPVPAYDFLLAGDLTAAFGALIAPADPVTVMAENAMTVTDILDVFQVYGIDLGKYATSIASSMPSPPARR